MAQQKTANRNRFDFSKIPATIQIPNLIEVQKRSYDRFLQMDSLPSERDDARLAGGVSVRVSRSRTSATSHSWTLSSTPSATGSASAATSRG